MEKNTKWAIALSTVVLVGAVAAQVLLSNRKAAQGDGASPEAGQTVAAAESSASAGLSSGADFPSQAAASSVVSSSAEQAAEESFVVETGRLRVVLTNRGGDVTSLRLKEHLDRDTGEGVEMINNVTRSNRAFSVAFGQLDSPIVNDVFTARRLESAVPGEQKIGFFREFTKRNADGSEGRFTFVKTYTFREDDYFFRLDVNIEDAGGFRGLDTNGVAYTLRTAPQIGPRFDPKDRYDVREFVAFDGDKSFTPKSMKEREWQWVASVGKYFEILVAPAPSVQMSDVMRLVTPEGDSTDNQAVVARRAVSGNADDSYMIYVGPRSESEMKRYVKSSDNAWGIDASQGGHFDESLPTSGILNWIEIVLKFIMQLIYRLVPNWGVSIIVMTVLLKLALFPLSKKSLEGTQKMQAYQPRIKEIQEKYKSDPRRMQEETAKLYKEIGYNPMAGCLPLIIQFVILWSMYHLFNNYFEFRGASFIDGWISDLSSTDTVTTLPFSIPWLGNELHLLPIIYLGSQLLYGKITANGGTAAGQSATQMKIMMYGMPVMFFFLFYNAPSGLLLYWTVSNVFQLIQQLIVNRWMKSHPAAPVAVKAGPKAVKKGRRR